MSPIRARLFCALGLALIALAVGASAQTQDAHTVDGYKYLYSTDLAARQPADVIRSVSTKSWDHGLKPRGMHRCARVCRREGRGGVCVAWTFCYANATCALLSQLPAELEPAAAPAQQPLGRGPGAVAAAAAALLRGGAGDGNAYDAKCASGVSEAAAVKAQLRARCGAEIHEDVALGDTLSLTAANKSKLLRATWDANQPSAVDCCAACAALRDEGCTSWQYNPSGWFMDAEYKCTLRGGVNPTFLPGKGKISGIMKQQ